jgi:ATPase family associated with various cellular activities (AAA)
MNASHDWDAMNQQTLTRAIDRVQQRLQAFVDRMSDPDGSELKPSPFDFDANPEFQNSALQTLCSIFRLSPFERDLLLLCAGVELSSSVAQLCAIAQGNPTSGPTFSLALALFPDAHWSALVPAYPLRRWRLIDVSPADSLTQSRLRIEERVLHYLNGVSYLDDRLCGIVSPILPQQPPILPQSHLQLVDRILDRWRNDHGWLIQLYGTAPDSQQAIATTVCDHMGIQLHRLAAFEIPKQPADRETLARLWEREATLNPSGLLIDLADIELDRSPFILPWIITLQSRIIIITRDPVTLHPRPTLRLEVPKPSAQEQQTLWRLGLLGQDNYTDDRADNSISNDLSNFNEHLEQLVSQFELDAPAIQDNCREFKLQRSKLDVNQVPDPTLGLLWETCRSQSRLRLDELAQRIPARAHWQDLVLPDRQQDLLAEIMAQVRSRSIVYNRWGFGDRGSNGFGISALFSGPSGTGKTLAAEVISHELQLDLYRIDLSQVVSKYIGETEKNLRRIFDAAETGGAILLFDEADALFGKRSEVKDSHDRHANVEVSYLLQRMEAYRGLAILTTNLQGSIDPAFLRRIRFLIPFPFPDQGQRTEIWKRMFSPNVPLDGVDFNQLAQLNVAGGNIRTIALNAAFLAADARSPLQMAHLLRSATSEYLKLDKTLTNAEVTGWNA